MTEEQTDDSLSLGSLLLRAGLGLVVLLTVTFVLGLLLREPAQALSGWFVNTFGLGGVFLGVLAVDATLFGVSEPVMFFGYEGGLGFWPVVLVAGVGSWCAGPLGWVIGRALGQMPFLQRAFEKYKINAFMKRYGTAAVAVGAITPFPYALTTYAAGATGISIVRVMLGALLRFPKCIVYLAVVLAGWFAGS